MGKYKRRLGSRPYQNYDSDTLKNCISAIREQRMSVSEAARTFNIPVRTIYRKMKIPPEENLVLTKCGHPTVFTLEEEQSFVQHLLLLAEYDIPITTDELKMCVRNYLEEAGREVKFFKNNTPGKEWVYGFLRRHSCISQRVAENVKLIRAAVNEKTLEDYIAHLEKSLEGIPPENIYNYDETNLRDDPGKKKVDILSFCIFFLQSSGSGTQPLCVLFSGIDKTWYQVSRIDPEPFKV